MECLGELQTLGLMHPLHLVFQTQDFLQVKESWFLLMNGSSPTPQWDTVHELQSWSDGSVSDAEMRLLLPVARARSGPSLSCFWCVVTTLRCGKVVWGGFPLESSCLKDALAQGARSRREYGVRLSGQCQSFLVPDQVGTLMSASQSL